MKQGDRKKRDREWGTRILGRQANREELLANIRRLTIAVLDNLEEGSRDNTLDQGQKRLLSSAGSRLLRLWRSTLNDDPLKVAAGDARKSTSVFSQKPADPGWS
jgi:hypothetical protein